MFFEWFSHWDWDRSHWRLGRIGPKTELIYVGLYPCNCFEGTGQKTIELLPMISKRTSFRPTFAHGYGGGVSWPHFCELSHQYFPAAPAASESLRSTEGRAVFRTPPPAPPRSVEKNDTMELSSRHGLGRRTREPCIFFASGLGCWKGSRCHFDHVINQEPGYWPRKDVREKVKEELRSTGWEGPH